QIVSGSGDLVIAPSTTTAEYVAIVLNGATRGSAASSFTLSANGIVAPVAPLVSASPFGGASFSRSVDGAGAPALERDVRFEEGLRARERALAPLLPAARQWYAEQRLGTMPSAAFSRSSLQSAPDDAFFFKLVNSPDTGTVNLSAVIGGDLAGFVRDWTVSHAVDDVVQLGTTFQQPSWNWHSIYPNLGTGGQSYPLLVNILANATATPGSVIPGGASFYRFAVNASGNATVSLNGGAIPSATMQLILVRTR
ncbi:MAG: hypothetical protein H0W68_10450, partial [Gemmatimonadaceae bacterium]|nr:hypothetical protein [Gemmatimonadaceae bacterium]